MARPRKSAGDTTPSKYLGADGRWHARITMGRRPGGGIDRKHVKRATRAELDKVVRALERSRDAGQYVWTVADPTLQLWLEHWLEAILPMSARYKTLATYRSQLRLHVIPVLGGARLSELRPELLERLYVDLLRSGRSGHTVRAVHRVLRSALSEAVRRQRIPANPALIARPPRVEVEEVDPFTVDECRRILAAGAAGRNAARWSVALSLGLRQGEALGLMWSDCDPEAGTLRIRRSVQRWTWRHGCTTSDVVAEPVCGRTRGADCPARHSGGLRLVEPKTKASRRTVVLPPPLVGELRAHRVAQARERLEAGPDWIAEHDLVFASETGGLIDPSRDFRDWKALLRTAGVRDMRLHDARHTAATLLLLQGVDLRTVMSIMGWTEMTTAQRYAHAVDDLRREAARRIGDALWRVPPEPRGGVRGS
jgi:integrase